MTSDQVIISIFFAVLFSFLCGLAFAFAAGDSKPRKRKTVFIALASGFLGWAFALFLPIKEYKFAGAAFMALFSAIYGCHIYWFIFKQTSKTTKIIDANGQCPRPQKNALNSI